eukprot:sb/3477672/
MYHSCRVPNHISKSNLKSQTQIPTTDPTRTRPARCSFECSSVNSRTCAQTPSFAVPFKLTNSCSLVLYLTLCGQNAHLSDRNHRFFCVLRDFVNLFRSACTLACAI